MTPAVRPEPETTARRWRWRLVMLGTVLAAVVAATGQAHADDPLDTAIREVCGMGGRSAPPFQLYGEKLSLEQRFGLTDAQVTSLMWQAINQGCP